MKSRRKGFTLIELSLSIAFIGVLALTVTLITNDMIATYRRGLTLNQINTVGMDLVDDMRTAFASSSAQSIRSACYGLYGDDRNKDACKVDGGKNLVILKKTAKIDIGGEKKDVPVYGVMCTGAYSYLWNSGYTFNGGHDEELKLTYKNGDKTETEEGFGLLKVTDADRKVCRGAVSSQGEYVENDWFDDDTIRLDESLEELAPEVLLAVDQRDNSLALYDLSMAKPAESGAINGVFYSVSFILGTLGGGINVTASGNYCAEPEDDASEGVFDYCAINKFNFAIRATGEQNG